MKGYPKLASLMGAHPDMAMFRRFGALNAENLLYLQAEIAGLEFELRRTAQENDQSGDEKRSVYSTHWYSLAHAENTPNGDGKQWALILQIRQRLKEYNDALLQQNQIAQLPTPSWTDREFLVDWMKRPKMGEVYLIDKGSDTWAKENASDLVALKSRGDEDWLTAWLMDRIPWYHRAIGRYFKTPKGETEYASNVVHYPNPTIVRIAHMICLVLASLLPIAAMTILYVVASMPVRIGLIAAFTAVFSLCLGSVTDTRMVDIFTATAAFAAVQVVFISNNGPTSGPFIQG